MLINHSEQTIIFTPFKNYSHSLIEYFTGFGYDDLGTLHPNIQGDVRNNHMWYHRCGRHGNIVPNVYQRYRRIVPVRNPYNRNISAWRYHSRVVPEESRISFEEYLMRGGKGPSIFPVTRIYAADHIVRVENLVEDFALLGIEVNPNHFPHSNQSDSSKYQDVLTDKHKNIISWWHSEDFDAGGYAR